MNFIFKAYRNSIRIFQTLCTIKNQSHMGINYVPFRRLCNDSSSIYDLFFKVDVKIVLGFTIQYSINEITIKYDHWNHGKWISFQRWCKHSTKIDIFSKVMKRFKSCPCISFQRWCNVRTSIFSISFQRWCKVSTRINMAM